MVDLAAKWSNLIYEEEMEKIAQVSIPHDTAQELLEKGTATPDITETTPQIAVPTILQGMPIVEFSKATYDIFAGTREQKAEAATKFIPYEVKKEEVTPPDYEVELPEYSYKSLKTFFDTGAKPDISQTELPESVKLTDNGYVENVAAEDFITNITTENLDKYVSDLIDKSKASSPEAKQFWETNTFLNTGLELPNFEFPDLGDIGKYLLIIAGIFGGVYLLGKSLGGKK